MWVWIAVVFLLFTLVLGANYYLEAYVENYNNVDWDLLIPGLGSLFTAFAFSAVAYSTYLLRNQIEAYLEQLRLQRNSLDVQVNSLKQMQQDFEHRLEAEKRQHDLQLELAKPLFTEHTIELSSIENPPSTVTYRTFSGLGVGLLDAAKIEHWMLKLCCEDQALTSLIWQPPGPYIKEDGNVIHLGMPPQKASLMPNEVYQIPIYLCAKHRPEEQTESSNFTVDYPLPVLTVCQITLRYISKLRQPRRLILAVHIDKRNTESPAEGQVTLINDEPDPE